MVEGFSIPQPVWSKPGLVETQDLRVCVRAHNRSSRKPDAQD